MRGLFGLARREAGANWRRNAVSAVILLGAIGTQMFTWLSTEATRVAVHDYGATVFGYPQTWQAPLTDETTLAQVDRLDAVLDGMRRDYPWASLVADASVPVSVTSPASPVVRPESARTLTAVHGPWSSLSATMADDPRYREIAGTPEGNDLLLSSEAATGLGVTGSGVVTVYYRSNAAGTSPGAGTPGDRASGTAGGSGGARSASGSHLFALQGVVAIPGPVEANKSLGYDVMGNHRLLHSLGVHSVQVSLLWRCDPQRCTDALGLATMAARLAGAQLSGPHRVDANDSLGPVLEQQRRQGAQFSLIVLVLGAVAVTVVAMAFMEIRSPEMVTLRTLGATRAMVSLLAILESLLVAALVAAAAVAMGTAVTYLDPNLLNHIGTVRLHHLSPPVGVYARTVLATLTVGLATSLLPAVRAYRSVRAS